MRHTKCSKIMKQTLIMCMCCIAFVMMLPHFLVGSLSPPLTSVHTHTHAGRKWNAHLHSFESSYRSSRNSNFIQYINMCYFHLRLCLLFFVILQPICIFAIHRSFNPSNRVRNGSIYFRYIHFGAAFRPTKSTCSWACSHHAYLCRHIESHLLGTGRNSL